MTTDRPGPTGLRRFVSVAGTGSATSGGARPRDDTAAATDGERCEMCAATIPADHGHVADLERAALLCTCRACYLLFTRPGAGLTASDSGRVRYRAVPDRYLADPTRPLSTEEWEELQVPVGLAFFLHDSLRDRVVGFYPGPAGVTQCQLDLAAWDRIAADHPLLRAVEPDVEAVLVHRRDEHVEHFLVPVDVCYELAGRMRLLWRGFDGGVEARRAVEAVLDGVRSAARPLAATDREAPRTQPPCDPGGQRADAAADRRNRGGPGHG